MNTVRPIGIKRGRYLLYARTDGRFIVYDPLGALAACTVSTHTTLAEALLDAQRLAAEDPQRAEWGEDVTPQEYAALAHQHPDVKDERGR